MGLFDKVMSAMGNSNEAATSGQLASILSTVQQVSSSYGTNPSTTQALLSIVGNHVRGALQQKRSSEGNEQAQAYVNQFSGSYPNPSAVHGLFSRNQEENLTRDASQRTGLNIGTIQQMLPILVPIVLNLLQTGTRSQNPRGGGNPVLNAFLDADRDGDVDIADIMHHASRHFGR